MLQAEIFWYILFVSFIAIDGEPVRALSRRKTKMPPNRKVIQSVLPHKPTKKIEITLDASARDLVESDFDINVSEEELIIEDQIALMFSLRKFAQRARIVALSEDKTRFQQILAEALDRNIVTPKILVSEVGGDKSYVAKWRKMDGTGSVPNDYTRKGILKTIDREATSEAKSIGLKIKIR